MALDLETRLRRAYEALPEPEPARLAAIEARLAAGTRPGSRRWWLAWALGLGLTAAAAGWYAAQRAAPAPPVEDARPGEAPARSQGDGRPPEASPAGSGPRPGADGVIYRGEVSE